MTHIMMLSDLYGRIGQILNEHGDAPIGYCKKPAGASEHNITLDWIEPDGNINHVSSDVFPFEIWKEYTEIYTNVTEPTILISEFYYE